MGGKLKGEHLFKFEKKDKKQLMSVNIERGVSVKKDVIKRGSLAALSVYNTDSTYLLKLHSKEFKGVVKEGNQHAYIMKKGRLS